MNKNQNQKQEEEENQKLINKYLDGVAKLYKEETASRSQKIVRNVKLFFQSFLALSVIGGVLSVLLALFTKLFYFVFNHLI